MSKHGSLQYQLITRTVNMEFYFIIELDTTQGKIDLFL
jgi:hypothetical protein